MKKSILLIGNTTSPSSIKLIDAAKEKGVIIDVITPQQIRLVENDVVVDEEKKLSLPFFGYDVYFFRGVGSSVEAMRTIAAVLEVRGKRVVERHFAEKGFPEDKFVPVSQRGLYAVPEYYICTQHDVDAIAPELVFPLVAKKNGAGSSKGKWVRKCDSLQELRDYIALAPTDQWVIQKYIPIDFDTRVLVVGGKVLGGFHRYRKDDKSFLTTAKANRREPAQLTEQEIEAAIEAATLQGLEIAGVDLFVYMGVIYVIEVNASPQFRVFDIQTGQKAAAAILEYLLG